MEIKFILDGSQQKISVPDSWEKLTSEQFNVISPALFRDCENNRIEILKVLCGAKAWKYLKKIDPYQLQQLCTYLNWLYQKDMISHPLKYISVGFWEKLYLPKKFLDDTTFLQFIYADKYFEGLASGDVEMIDKLVSVLCLSKGEKFDSDKCDTRLSKIKKISNNQKLGIVFFFLCCKAQLAKKYSVLFQEREDGEKPQSQTPDYGWLGVAWDLAGSIVNENEVFEKPLHNVLGYLCKKYYDNLKNGNTK